MAKHISNMNQLQAALMPTMVMVDELAERVYETLNYFLQEYYNKSQPYGLTTGSAGGLAKPLRGIFWYRL